jgi:hypothetical protein
MTKKEFREQLSKSVVFAICLMFWFVYGGEILAMFHLSMPQVIIIGPIRQEQRQEPEIIPETTKKENYEKLLTIDERVFYEAEKKGLNPKTTSAAFQAAQQKIKHRNHVGLGISETNLWEWLNKEGFRNDEEVYFVLTCLKNYKLVDYNEQAYLSAKESLKILRTSFGRTPEERIPRLELHLGTDGFTDEEAAYAAQKLYKESAL